VLKLHSHLIEAPSVPRVNMGVIKTRTVSEGTGRQGKRIETTGTANVGATRKMETLQVFLRERLIARTRTPKTVLLRPHLPHER
jgi:hypothetical protein